MTNPAQVDFTITLNGVDVTDHCDLNQEQPEIVSALDEELDTMTLTLQEADAINPVEWQEIIVEDGGTKIFGGYVIDVEKKKGNNAADNDYKLGCSDYAILLDKIIIKAEYLNKTDKEIIADVFTGAAELSTFDGATYVEEISTLPKVRFNRMTAREVLDWICEHSGGHWYMDYEKALHYFKSEEFSAAFDVSENPADSSRKTVENPNMMKSGAGVVNLVEVIGGNYLSEDRTDVFSAGGFTNTIRLLNRMSAPSTGSAIVVRRNDGGATTNLVVNPSFEVNITDGWTQFQDGSGAAWSQVAASGYKGTKVLKIVAGTALAGVRTANVSLAVGESITASCLVKCGTIGKAGIRIYNVTGSVVAASDLNRKANSIERVSANFTNTGVAFSGGSGGVSVRVELINEGNDSALEAFFDAVQFEKKSWPTAYCDGSLGDGYAWTGTANNSTSTREEMPVWTELDVRIGYIDELVSLDEVLYFYAEGRLEQLKFWPGIAEAVEVDGRYEIPMRTRVRNQASHDYYGHWLEGIISEPDIVDKTIGQMRGKLELIKNAYANPAITYTVLDPGLRAGQTQHVTLTSMGIDASYLIQRVTTTINVAGFVRVAVELGAVDQNLVGLLLKLKRASVPVIEWDENEVLDELLDSQEDVAMTEGTPAVSDHTGDYEWDDTCEWGYAAWG